MCRLKEKIHRIYLLTVWQEDEENWRFLLEDPRSGQRKGFADSAGFVEGLLVLVAAEAQESAPPDDHDA